jgi:hypothetical protein
MGIIRILTPTGEEAVMLMEFSELFVESMIIGKISIISMPKS